VTMIELGIPEVSLECMLELGYFGLDLDFGRWEGDGILLEDGGY
jgi:hypothetical protein